MARILVADDEQDLRRQVAYTLRDAGHDATEASDAVSAMDLLRTEPFDVLVTDLRMPGSNGIEVLREAVARMPDCILIVVTAFGSLDTAVQALRVGAHDYLVKPLKMEVLLRKIETLLRLRSTSAENRLLRRALEIDLPTPGLVGKSAAIDHIHRLIARVAPTDSTVLILGETGTGKELVARAIHQSSPRHDRPFVAINCGSLPEALLESELFGYSRGAFTGADRDKRGLFEVAEGGTIFLDEIGEMPLAVQPKILRTLESLEILRVGSTQPIKIAARIISATHRKLKVMMEEGKFRSDLFYRLNVFEISIPPLRERPEDIAPIANELLERLCRRMNRALVTVETEALQALERYPWPGNVRELANVMERALILNDGTRIRMSDLPGIFSESGEKWEDDLKAARARFEQAHVRRVLAKYSGDKKKASEALGIGLSSLYRMLEE